MSKVTIEVDSKWVKIVHSPLYLIVAALQGIAISFAPLFLFFAGKGMFPHGYDYFVALLCFAMILLVGFFYLRLGNEVIGELSKIQKAGLNG
jgi:hypothetical protein